MSKEINLKVMEALQEEAYKGIVRIDTETMKEIGVRVGDIIEIEGGRETVGIVDRAYPTDIGQTVIRMDGILRRNAKTGIGEFVKVRKADVKEAKTVTIAPAQKGVTIRLDTEMFKRGILGRAVVKGDIIALGGTRRRKSTLSDSPFFDDVFNMFEEDFMGGFGISGLRFVVVDVFPKGSVIITENTEVKFNSKSLEVFEEKVPSVTYEDVGGLTDEIKKVREMVELPLKHPELFERLGIEPPKGILLHGPPGCGKTLLAKAVANETDATFLVINGPEVVSKFVGEAEKKIREKFEEAEKKAPAILFIDEIDAIASKREESYGEVEKRMVAQLLATMDGMNDRGKVIVIAATNRPNSIDPALRRPGRFDREIEIGAPTKEGRLNILKIHTRNMPLVPPVKRNYLQKALEEVTGRLKENHKEENELEELKETQRVLKDLLKTLKNDSKNFDSLSNDMKIRLKPYLILGMLNEIAARTHGFVGADLASLCKEAALNVIRRVLPDINMKESQQVPKEVLEKLTISANDFEEAMKNVAPSGMREVLVEIPNIGWSDIGGLETIKRELIEAVEWPLKYPEKFKQMGIRPPKGVLLYGPPGCGKTLLAKAVAYESESNFILVKGPELLNKWVGESLPYNEELIVNQNGQISKMKIGEIVENRISVEVLAFDNEKRLKFVPIQDFIKHKQTSNLLEVETESGRKIRVTSDHSLFTLFNGNLMSISTNYLIPGESFVAVPRLINFPEKKIENINLFDAFAFDKDIFVENVSNCLSNAKKILGTNKVAEILNVTPKYLFDIVSKNLPVSLINFRSLIHEANLKVNLDDIKIKIKGSEHSYPALFKVNPNFWRLIGVWIAEGDFNGYAVRIYNQNPEILADLENISKEFGFSISKLDDGISINSLLIQKLFSEFLGLVSGASEKSVPKLVFSLDKKSKANLLKGYFSGDGSNYPVERGKFKIEASTISKKLADDLLLLLMNFGITCRTYLKTEKTGSISYRLCIMGVDKYRKFLEIGFIDQIRNSRIKKYIESRKWERSDLIPLSGELREIVEESGAYFENEVMGRKRLKQVLLASNNSLAQKYLNLVDGDLCFERIKNIQLLPPQEFVYDISVEEGQNFVAGFGGICAHNSEKGVREIFRKARQVAPTIIFFDEIDAIAVRRGQGGESNVTERIVNTLLTEIDGLEELKDVVVIAATNRPDILDPALLRPGRFDRVLLTPLPDEKARMDIFKMYTEKKNMPLAKDVNFKFLVEKTVNYVGSDIEGVCREAAMLALRDNIEAKEVSMKNFESALEKVRGSIREEDMNKYKQIEDSYIRTARGAQIAAKVNYTG